MAKEFWRFVRNEKSGEQILRLDGAIIGDALWFEEGKEEPTAKKFREELKECEGAITVWLNSEGGDFWAATEIYNLLREYKGKVKIKIDAIALSAASVIAMAGDEVEITPVGMIMIHNPWLMAQGDASELKRAVGMLEEVKESVINAYENKTKLPREQLSEMMDAETWMHAQKAVELGFADRISWTENKEEEEITGGMSTRREIMNRMLKPRVSKRITAGQLRRELERKIGEMKNGREIARSV